MTARDRGGNGDWGVAKWVVKRHKLSVMKYLSPGKVMYRIAYPYCIIYLQIVKVDLKSSHDKKNN